MILEKVKSGMLVTLFVSCLLLAGQLLLDFQGSGSDSTSMRAANLKPISYETILYPQSCSISFGGGLYKGVFSTEAKRNLWQESRKYVKNYVDFLDMKKMTQGEWDAAVKTKAVRFVMPFSISINEIQSILLTEAPHGNREDITFDTLIIPVNEDQEMYIGNTENREYHLLKGIKRDVFLGTLIADYEKEADSYDGKSIEELFAPSKVLSVEGESFVSNNVLFPITTIPDIPFVRVEDEISLGSLSEQQIKTYVGNAFGYRNDFLKKIEDIDGSVVYLYGYGDRALKIGSDGAITYNNRFEKQPIGEEYTVKAALFVAIEELEKFGPLPEGYYLSHYEDKKDKDGNMVKRLSFNYEMENLPIYLEEDGKGQPMVVEITGKQVTSVKRKLHTYQRTFSVGEIWDAPMLAQDFFELNFDVISKNYAKYDYISKTGAGSNPIDNEKFPFELIQNIKSINLVYYGNSAKSESLIPAWHVFIGSNEYIINIYSGEILKWIPPKGVK